MNSETTVIPALVFASEAARLLGISEQTLRTWEHSGRLVPQRIGGREGVRVFLRATVEQMAADRNARIAIEGHARKASASLRVRIAALLETEGPLEPRVIAERLEAAEISVRVALSRGKKIGRFHRVPRVDGPARWGVSRG